MSDMQQGPTAFVGDGLQIGLIQDGAEVALGFRFTDSESGNVCPTIVLTNAKGMIGQQLVELFQSVIGAPEPEVSPVAHCRDCRCRIFGDLIDKGQCVDCEKKAASVPSGG